MKPQWGVKIRPNLLRSLLHLIGNIIDFFFFFFFLQDICIDREREKTEEFRERQIGLNFPKLSVQLPSSGGLFLATDVD